MSLLRKLLGAAEVLAESWPGLGATEVGVQALLEYLVAFGYVDDGNATPAHVSEAIRRLQAQAGMAADGIPGPITQRIMGMKRCGVPEHARTGTVRWGKTQLTIGVQQYVTGLDRLSQDQAIADLCAELSGYCDLTLTRSREYDRADIVITASASRREGLGTKHDVLAYAYMPGSASWDSPLQIVFDLAEQWIVDPRLPGTLWDAVLWHEFLHALGLDHSTIRTALESPYYQSGVRRPVDPDDITRLQALYGPPKQQQPAGESVRVGIDLAGYKLVRV